MKKIVLLVLVAVIATSCGNQLSIVKRHYTKGFYVQNHKQNSKTSVAKKDNENKPGKLQPVATSFLAENKTVQSTISASVNSVKQKEVIASTKKTFVSQLRANADEAVQPLVLTQKSKLNLHKENGATKKQTKASGGDDTDKVIWVILSLFPFINLIAVYLHDGKAITANFWIDLILDILFFLPGIIFALLVVLDVVNLA